MRKKAQVWITGWQRECANSIQRTALSWIEPKFLEIWVSLFIAPLCLSKSPYFLSQLPFLPLLLHPPPNFNSSIPAKPHPIFSLPSTLSLSPPPTSCPHWLSPQLIWKQAIAPFINYQASTTSPLINPLHQSAFISIKILFDINGTVYLCTFCSLHSLVLCCDSLNLMELSKSQCFRKTLKMDFFPMVTGFYYLTTSCYLFCCSFQTFCLYLLKIHEQDLFVSLVQIASGNQKC